MIYIYWNALHSIYMYIEMLYIIYINIEMPYIYLNEACFYQPFLIEMLLSTDVWGLDQSKTPLPVELFESDTIYIYI